jgi:hypothetical protein
MAALMVFTVSYAGIRLKVRVLPHAKDVYKECTGAKKWRMRAELPEGFFQAPARPGKYTGTIVVAGNCNIAEIVPHEVVHAVIHKLRSVETDNDEAFALAVGILSARIARKIERRFYV